jgi:mitogen-activated protein kinase kinase kinase
MTSSPIQWIQGEAIGEGTFGKVFKGLNEKTGELLAIKQMYLTDGSQKEVEELQKEINVMWELDHENIVRYLGTSRNEKCLFIILEYVTGGSIASMLTQFGFFRETLLR